MSRTSRQLWVWTTRVLLLLVVLLQRRVRAGAERPAAPADASAVAVAAETSAAGASFESASSDVRWSPQPPPRSDVGPDALSAPSRFRLSSLRQAFEPPSGPFAWEKAGHRVVPYGVLWGSAHYDTSRTSPGAYTLFVESGDREGEPTFEIDTRRTRVGLNVECPRVNVFGGTRLSGRLEIDFHGSFVVENKPGVLLRHAYGQLSGDGWSLLAGQTTDVISPLLPHSLNYSVGWGAGNIGYRRMQVRWEQQFAVGEEARALLQLAVAQNIVSDFRAAKGVEPESSSWPMLQGRVAFSWPSPFDSDQPVVVGLSGHVGQQGFDFTEPGPAPLHLPPEDDARLLTYSFNLDAEVPLSSQAGVRGEFFVGQDLSTFLGGIVQGVNPITRQPIRARGGWIELYYHWTPRWHSYCGWSVDDPDARFPGGRTLNQFLYVNTSHDFTERLNLGFEVRWWSTHYFDQSSGEAVQFEFAGEYKF